MKKVFFKFWLILLLSSSIAFGWGFFGSKYTQFDVTKYNTPKKILKKLLNEKLKKVKKLGIKKLVILECYGEYVTSRSVTQSLASQHSAANKNFFYTVKTRTESFAMDKDFYTNTSNRVYDAVREIFTDNGIKVVSAKELANNKVYKEFNLKEEKAGRGVTSGYYKPTIVEKSQKVSATGLGLFPTSVFQRIKLIQSIAEITSSVGADGMLQINFKIDKDKNLKPVLKSFNIIMCADLRSQKVGWKGHKKLRYDFYTQWYELVKLKKEIENVKPVLKDKKKLDIVKYDKALMEMLYGITNSLKVRLKDILD